MVSNTKKTRRASGHLLLPPTMRDFASCFSEHAVRVSDSSCSGSSSGNSVLDPSVQSAVSCLYRTRLSTQKELLINVTWSKSHTSPALSIGIDECPSRHSRKPRAMSPWVLREKTGRQSFVSDSSVVGLYWDLSSAKYGSGPEPIEGFYVVVIVHEEFALLLGEMSGEFIKEFKETVPIAEFSMVSRREQLLGRTFYLTKARFRDDGTDHEISIKCKGDSCNTANSELSVCIDKKRVVHVTKLGYNFRGNQTLFVDGSPVDLLWDMHDWWFSNPSGYAVFMFRKRSTLESRLWLEEEMLHKEQGMPAFSLVIQAFKSPMKIAD